MKDSKQKIQLNKQTISDLKEQEMGVVRAGAEQKCWENLWTNYECQVVRTT